MKINEIILVEDRDPGASNTPGPNLPNEKEWPSLNQNNDSYKQYRFGVACARSPDPQESMATTTHQNLVTVGYTKADEEILDAAAKVVGVTPGKLSGSRGMELPEVNKQSPISPRKKNRYGV